MGIKLSLFLVAAAVVIGSSASIAETLDPGAVACRAFLASGQANMAVLISWLRGYHAAKTGIIPYPFGGRLGFYCKQHPDANLIETSEQILSELDRGL